jgi:RNA polymerase sigma-70 factor (ECF subfamily)
VSEVPVTDWAAAEERQATARALDFDAFYLAELPRLVALARGLCGAAIAEDVAQEAMLAAYRRWSHVAALERPDLWVRRTCANLAVSQFRRRVVELRALTRFGNRPEGLAELQPANEEVWSAVRRLPARQAQVAALRFVYDMPIADIAAALDCTQGTVKQHLSRARHHLAGVLGVDPEETP